MIIGRGLIANAFKEYANNEDIVIFASGVSNSKETSKENFLREEELLRNNIEKFTSTKRIVYFSTCSMFDTYFERSEYTKHKMNMEQIITEKALSYNIFRLPQVLGRNNKNQLIGFLYDAIKMEKSFELFNIERNIINIEDVFLIIHNILKDSIFNNQIINIANSKNIRVIDLVGIIEKITDKKAKYNIIEKPGSFIIEIKNIESIIYKLNIFEEIYLEKSLRHYYE